MGGCVGRYIFAIWLDRDCKECVHEIEYSADPSRVKRIDGETNKNGQRGRNDGQDEESKSQIPTQDRPDQVSDVNFRILVPNDLPSVEANRHRGVLRKMETAL